MFLTMFILITKVTKELKLTILSKKHSDFTPNQSYYSTKGREYEVLNKFMRIQQTKSKLKKSAFQEVVQRL